MILRTEQLDLHPRPVPVLESLLAGDLERTRVLVPFRVDADSFADDEYVLGLRAEQLRADPAELPWRYRAVVLARLGFVRTGEQLDEVDGLEWVFTREPLPGGGGLR